MIQSLPKQITFDEFIAWYPEHSEYRYELHNEEIIQMPKPIGKHSEVGGYISLRLGMEIERLQQPYFIPRECWVCDYLGLGGKRYIGSPKQPTFSVYQLNEDGEYEVRQFRGEQAIASKVFPELQLSLNQVLDRINS
ncbi:Uma2 family endonuclease [Cyanobacteria bacterium FACHB-63]|nr:Uma2 family endonuclease [Cyanobacteria bacterium FACHB-63]